ncbi:MAG: hypothetical protein B9S32_09445 [Verrucomicrobia bacterium Tous-C9LFEB]|nr:MAG: hypothetical protein B9S32_09445 [Verrucomicrobia bacterium Tous-C9LFEB]
MKSNAERGRCGAYTLIELLAAMATLCVILLMLFTTTGMATLAWKENSASTETFQQARTAFSTVTRRLSQATLNSYRDYYNTASSQGFTYPDLPANKTEYRTRSELHFLTGRAADLMPDASATRPTHAVFFQAPFGYQKKTDGLRSLLNVCGYYVEYGDDSQNRPSFTSASSGAKKRSRLYEVMQPSEEFALYKSGTARGWLTGLVTSSLAANTHALAENIIALILLPQRRPDDTDLAPRYAYDSRAWLKGRTTLGDLTQNQLPPLVQVTMVVIDEPSAKRLQDQDQLKDLVDASLFQDAAQFNADWQRLQDKLKGQCRYRCFQTTVSLASSTWSESAP